MEIKRIKVFFIITPLLLPCYAGKELVLKPGAAVQIGALSGPDFHILKNLTAYGKTISVKECDSHSVCARRSCLP
jgi:hypothetical protein